MNTQSANVIVVLFLTGLAFFLRFYKLGHPDQVVYVVSRYIRWLLTNMISFDEVHFGKFAGFYIKREYYFDVHPPFAKLLFGLAGWFVGFDGQFQFENIGDSYTENHVPYVGMRALSAIFGSLTIPVVYGIMKESGYSTVVAAFSASLILFGMIVRPMLFAHSQLDHLPDNAHVAQSRLILLDSILIFFMALTIYSYIRFRKLRYL